MKDFKTFFNMLRQMFSLMSCQQLRNAAFVLLVAIVAALFETLGVAAILPFVQALTSPEQLRDQWYIGLLAKYLDIRDTSQLVILTGIGIILIYVIKNACILFSSYTKNYFATSMTKELSVQVMDSFMHRPYSYFTDHNSGEILRGVGGDVGCVNGVLINLMQALSEGMIVLAIGVYLFIADPMMALGVVFVGMLTAFLIIMIMKRHMSRMGQLSRKADGEGNKVAVQIAQGIKDIFVMQKHEMFMRHFVDTREETRKANLLFQISATLPERIIETFCVGGIIAVVLFRFSSGVNVATFVSSLAVFAMAAFRILPSISRISSYISGMIYYRPGLDAAYGNIMAARDYMHTMEAVQNHESDDEQLVFTDKIAISNVRWKYADGQEPVLDNLSLTIRKGESVGIIGESGAGKSTLSDILLGLYVPQSGCVTVDGKSIFSMPKTWSHLMGYVPQSVYLIDDTVRMNVAFGDEAVDDGKIWDALEKASLNDFIESLPNGLDTIVGERGVKFSGGQRQRIAIARALYRNPCILILDEATSALDNETETAVMEAIDSLQGTMTMIIIAHRITTIKNCDHIYEIRDGKAIEHDKREIFG